MTIHLDESDIKNIILAHFKDKGYQISSSKVVFNVGAEWIGYRDTVMVPILTGCDIINVEGKIDE